jgi:hypothetical protein
MLVFLAIPAVHLFTPAAVGATAGFGATGSMLITSSSPFLQLYAFIYSRQLLLFHNDVLLSTLVSFFSQPRSAF